MAKVKIGRRIGIKINILTGFLLLILYSSHLVILLFLVFDRTNLEEEIYNMKKTIDGKEKTINEQQARLNKMDEEIIKLKQRIKVVEIVNNQQIGLTVNEIHELSETVWSESIKYGLDPLLILAAIKTESSFKKWAISNNGALGLMQILPSTAKGLAVKRGWTWYRDVMLFQPRINIILGMQYLMELFHEFNDLEKAFIAYNLGTNEFTRRLDQKKSLPSFYIKSLFDNYNRMKKVEKFKELT